MGADSDLDLRARLGRAVRDRREELHLTQHQLAEQAKVGVNTIIRIEQGNAASHRTAAWGKLEAGLGWPRGRMSDYLAGKVGEPSGTSKVPTDPNGPPSPTDAWAELADRLPASFVHELATGKVFATDVQDLTLDGGLRVFTVVIRNPGQEPRSPERVKAETEAWYRTQRELRQRAPVDTGSDSGESGHE